MRVQRKPAVAVAVAAALATAFAASPAQAGNTNNSAKFRSAVTVAAIMHHLEQLQAVADAHGGNRAAGTSGYAASGDYVQGVLEDAGYTVTRQVFDIAYQAPGQLQQVSPNAVNYPTDSYTGSGAGDVTATVTPVDLQLGLGNTSSSGCEAADFAGFPAGNIALIQRGTCAFAVKAVNAQAAGAAAVVIFNQGNTAAADRQGLIVGTLNPSSAPITIPVVGGSYSDGLDLSDPPGTRARVFAATIEQRPTFNLLAETKTGRADNIVMLGAHLDSVEAGPGINDNGSGSASILETAVQLAKVNKVNNKVRFAWWGAEEAGLLGSTHYVNDLVANAPAELAKIATYVNFDMVASPNHQIGVYDADQSTYPAPAGVPIPPGSIETEDVLTSYFDSIGQPWVDTQFSGRSDYQAFIVNGVSASGLFTGAEVPKPAEFVPLFGGTAGIAFDVNYHGAGDTIGNINTTALDINSDAIAHLTITLAQSTEPINGARSAGKSGNPHPSRDGLQPVG